MRYIKNLSLSFIAFLQALGIVSYCSLVGFLIWQGEKFFGPVNNFLGPVLFLTLFIVSALITALIGLGYAGFLFFKEKKQKKALKLIGLTAGWLLLFVLILIFILALS